jgi:hypothetical protein
VCCRRDTTGKGPKTQLVGDEDLVLATVHLRACTVLGEGWGMKEVRLYADSEGESRFEDVIVS